VKVHLRRRQALKGVQGGALTNNTEKEIDPPGFEKTFMQESSDKRRSQTDKEALESTASGKNRTKGGRDAAQKLRRPGKAITVTGNKIAVERSVSNKDGPARERSYSPFSQ